MKTLLGLGLLTTVFALAHGWSKYFDDSIESWAPARRSHTECSQSGGKCFTSGECCEGFVCAAFDDYFGTNPEVPGYCVREKDLLPCFTSKDCPPDQKCRTLGKNGGLDRYCVKRSQEVEEEPKKPMFKYPKMKNSFGMSCKDDGDCAQYTADGSSKLCCQNVNRGRQGKKRMCDRVTRVSQCIPPNA